MFDGADSWNGIRGQGLDGGPRICVDVNHPAWQRAARLLEALGGCRSLAATGMVYGFLTLPVRDEALDLVRSRMGWTIAQPDYTARGPN